MSQRHRDTEKSNSFALCLCAFVAINLFKQFHRKLSMSICSQIRNAQESIYSTLNSFSERTDYKKLALLGRVVSVPAAIADVCLDTLQTPVKSVCAIFSSVIELEKCITGRGSFKAAVLFGDTAIQYALFTPVAVIMFPLKLIYQIRAGIVDPKNVKPFLPKDDELDELLLVKTIEKNQDEFYWYSSKAPLIELGVAPLMEKRVIGSVAAVFDLVLELSKPFLACWERTCLTVMHLAGCTIREGYSMKLAIDNAERALCNFVLIPYTYHSTKYKMAYQVAMNIFYPETARPFHEFPDE